MTRGSRRARAAATLLVAALVAVPALAGAGRSPQGPIIGMHPYAYWPLDEQGSSVVFDHTSHHFDGLYEGARSGADGSSPGKRAAIFTGIPGINLVGEEAAIQGDAPRTIIAWIRTSNPQPQAIVATGHADEGGAFNLVMGYGGCASLGVAAYRDDFNPCGRILSDGNWHMVAATYDGAGTLKLYVDGALDASTTNIRFATWGQNNYIGRSNRWGEERVFMGSIDDVAIFDRALAPAEIALLGGI